ncbi:MAG: hypothetical protein GXO49_08075 [Chlorobi bacterium]|nr:hypothetical protein [Chlorobiota bacterium]
MKQIKLLSATLLILFILNSCNKTPHDKIMGSWDITKIENPKIEDTDIDAFKELNKEALDNEVFTFTEEKVTKKLPEASEGTWEMDEAGTILTIDWGEGDIMSPHSYTIKALTNDNLIIEEDFDDFIITTTFEKVK